MNNILSYCGLVDARISASEKDLPVSPLARRHIHSNQYLKKGEDLFKKLTLLPRKQNKNEKKILRSPMILTLPGTRM